MFNWKKLFKKRVDPKDIPVLEDIIDDINRQSEVTEDYPNLFSGDSELTTEDDEFVIDLNEETDIHGNSEDEDNVVILSSVIGETDLDIDEIDVTEIETSESNDTELDDVDIDVSETDSPAEAATETNLTEKDNYEEDTDTDDETVEITTDVSDAEVDPGNEKDNETDQDEISVNHPNLSDPEQLEIIVNKVVEKLKPEVDAQLHSFVKNALSDKSPEEFLKSLNLDDKSTSDKS